MANFIFTRFKINMMSVSFCGLKENIQYGHDAIARVKEDYPNGFKSNTYYDTFVEKQDPDVRHEYTQAIYRTRDIIDEKIRHGKSEREATEIAVSKTGAANCGEQAFLVSNRLNEMGIKNKVINMVISSNTTRMVQGGHTFCVIDTDNPIDPREPRSWSSDAVVVDMWANKVMKAQDAINYFYSLFKPDSTKQFVQFTRVFE